MADLPSAQEVMSTQGTRLSDLPPWMSYASEFDEKIEARLQSEIDEYSQRRHEQSSAQNEEELCRQRELNDGVAKDYRWLTPEEYADMEPRIGKVMHSSEFITALRDRANVKCWYRAHPHPDKITLVYSNTFSNEEPQIACWVQAGFMPEYSLMNFDEHGAPLAERRRGWRTCLLQIILKGIISNEDATRIFGPATGPASERYNGTIYQFRKSVFEGAYQGGE